MNYIYRLTSPSGKIYIGQTNNFKRRMNDHKKRAYQTHTPRLHRLPLYCAIRKYGWDKFDKKIILDTNEQFIDELEMSIIQYCNSTDKNVGYNCTEGGDKPPGNKGRKLSEATKRKISHSLIGNQFAKGYKHSTETRAKVSAGNQMKRAVYQIDKITDEIIAEYPSVTAAAKSMGRIDKSIIYKVANHRVNKEGHQYRTAVGFKWEYVDQYTCLQAA